MAALAPPQPVNTNPDTNTNTDANKDNKRKVKGDRPPLPLPSHGMTGSERGAADGGVVMGGVEEARGNLQSLRGKIHRSEAKLGRCRELDDVSGGIAAGEKVLQGKRRPREAQRALEELEGKWASMDTGDGGVKVEEGGDNIVHLGVGVEGHPEGHPVVAEEEEGGGLEYDGGGGVSPPSCMSPSGCARKWVQAWQPKLPLSPEQGGWWVPTPPPPCRKLAS